MTETRVIRGILFDKDGTLLDYAKSWLPVNRELADYAADGDALLAARLLRETGMDPETGHVVPDSLLAAGNTREIAQGLVDAGALRSFDDLVAYMDGLFASAAARAVPVTDLKVFFEALHGEGYKLGIASSDNERSIRHTAERFGFSHLVHYVAGYDSGFGTKPEPGMVIGFSEATGLALHEIAVVGDNNHDLHMGQRAGAGLKIGVLTGTGSRHSLGEASDHCLNDITELPAILAAL